MSIFDGFNEADLLAWIEGDLDVVEARRLEERLRAEPRVMAVLEQMRSDRTLLREAIPPEMPKDVLAAIEPQLARPMLIEHQPPGAYRRRHRRRQRGRHLRRAAVAAAVALFVGGGIWTVLTSWPGAAVPEQVATNDVDEPGPPNDGAGAAVEALVELPADDAAPPEGTIHHRLPIGSVPSAVARADGAAPAGDDAVIAVGFALVLEAPNVDTAEQAIDSTLADLDGPALAFVRHFNEAELQMILNDAAVARSRDPRLVDVRAAMEGSDLVSAHDLSPARWSALEEPMQRLRRAGTDDDADVLIGRQLRGPKERSPGYAEQLELSRRGVSHTVTLSVDDLKRLLATMRAREDAASRLVVLPGDDEAVTTDRADDLGAWLEELRAIQGMLADLRAEHGVNAVIQLPVVVRPAE
jgi:anti-sigma factor RsiW